MARHTDHQNEEHASRRHAVIHTAEELTDGKVKLCTLPPSVRSCPYKADPNLCGSPSFTCGFLKIPPTPVRQPKDYVRKERWYEKYYK